MAKLKVRFKNGVEREITQKAYDLIGFKRKPQILGKVEPVKGEKTELEELKDKMRAEKAAKEQQEFQPIESTKPTLETESPDQSKKRGRKAKNTEA